MAVTVVAARDAISPFVGDVYTYQVENHAGSEYQWQVYQELVPLTAASSSAYQFTNSNTASSVGLQWLAEGAFFLMVRETAIDGCSNLKAIRIEVNPNDEILLSFTNPTSTQCYQTNNDFNIALQFFDADGNPFTAGQFPVQVSFQVNGAAQTTQTITFSNQQLQINEPAFSADETQNTTVSVTLVSATDANDLTILPQTGQNIHTHTIFALPQISFTQTSETILLGEERSFTVNPPETGTETENWTYSWLLISPDGTEVSLSSATNQSDEITFTQIGDYQLRVQASNSESCQSEWATKTITVAEPPQEELEPVAVRDINLTWTNTTVTGNVLTNDLFFKPESSSLSIVTIPLEATGQLTSFNKSTGDYTFVPVNGFSGEAVFEYKICSTIDGQEKCSTTAVTIQVLGLSDENRPPVASDDVFVIFSGNTVNGSFLFNDFDPESGPFSISQVETDNLPGAISWKADGSFAYTSPTGYTGEAHFNYEICDQSGNCDWATVTILVLDAGATGKNLFAGDDAFFATGNLTGSLAGNESSLENILYLYEPGPLTSPSNGTIEIQADGHFIYTPNPEIRGTITDQFSYKIYVEGQPLQFAIATAYILGNITDPVIYVKSNFETGSCKPVTLDASNTTGTGNLIFNWEPATYLSNANSAAPVFSPEISGTFIYTLTVTDANGNSSQRDVTVVVDEAPQVVTDKPIFVNNPTDVIMLDASASTGVGLSYSWTAQGGGLIVSGANMATPQVAGLGKYYLQITDTYGCTARDSVTVGLLVQVNAMNDTVGILINTFADINVLRNDVPAGQLDPQSVTIVSSPNFGFASVTSDSIITYTPNQFYVGQDNFVYSVCDYFENCDEATVLVIINDDALFVPNAFSPNGDGLNDYFEIVGVSSYERVSLKIFNRWGNAVYESSNYGPAGDGFWDGAANKGVRTGSGQVASGTYYYILDLGNGNEKISGFIYLDR
jgi:gliding motility-associated-like protein